MLEQVFMIGFMSVMMIISAPLYIITGIMIICEILEVKAADEEYRCSQLKATNQNEKE